VCLLTKYLSQEETYLTIHSLGKNRKFEEFLKYDTSYYSQALLALLKVYNPVLYEHICSVAHTNFADLALRRFFVDCLSYEIILQLLDCFLFEGPKVLFKISLHLLQTNYDLSHNIHDYFKSNSNFSLETAMELKLPSANVVHELATLERSILPNFDGLSDILVTDQLNILWYWLPPKLKLCPLKRIFRSSKDGFNLNTLMVKCKRQEGTIIIIKTSSQKIFGAYVSCLWEKTEKYTGTGEMFVFNMTPPKKYQWTKENSFFFMLDQKNNYLMIGGGEGTAIYLDEELNHGSSRKCETFDNDPLNHSEVEFDCVGVEVFSFE